MEDNFGNTSREFPHEKDKRKAALSAAALTPLDEVWITIGDIEYLTAESLTILKQRGQEWYDRWPLGEPYFSRDGNYSKIDIYSNQVAGLLKIDMHVAKNILMVAARILGADPGKAVTVKQFCHLFNLNEEEVRQVIQYIPPDSRLN